MEGGSTLRGGGWGNCSQEVMYEKRINFKKPHLKLIYFCHLKNILLNDRSQPALLPLCVNLTFYASMVEPNC